MYTLAFGASVLDELADQQRYQAKVFRQIVLKIMSLTLNPTPQDCKRIGDGYRVDSGEYRIYYDVDHQQRVVTIQIVGKRNDDEVYRRLRRRLGG